MEAVIEALQREQSGSFAGNTLRIEDIVDGEAMRGNVQSSAPNARIGDADQPRTQDSFIKARFALTVLRIAQTTDHKTAARLVRGLAHDFPHPNERQEIAGIHLRAIEAFFQLAANLEDVIGFKQQNFWSFALAAAQDWLRVVSR
jgi:hypothetical protein